MTRVSAVTDDILSDLDGVAIGRSINSGQITALEAVGAAIARLQSVDPLLHAMVSERFEQALAEAVAVPGRVGGELFAGVPSLIKDNTDLAGLPTRHGSRGISATPAAADAGFTRIFRATGLIPIGKSALPEFGLTATTEPGHRPATRNPWNTNHSSGGSSGGSAALVAAGVVPLAHANDGGGSIRIPAACCGVVGLKPSRGRLPTIPLAQKMPINIIVEGVVSRTVRDTAGFYAEAERHYQHPSLPPIGHVVAPGRERQRIGLCVQHPLGGGCDPEVVARVEQVARCCEELGHRVEQVPLPVTGQMADDFFLYWARLAAAANYLGRFAFGKAFDRHLLEPLTCQLSRHYLVHCWRSPAAIRRLRKFSADYQALFTDHDLILTPVLATPPVELGYLGPDLDFATVSERLRHYAAFTPAQNIAGTPAISLPLGRSAGGLPIGVQFAAGMGQESRLLEIAFEMEQAMPWSWPSQPA
ncbi:MAG: amidase [Halieaceae bacterium]|jgi:amidase|nr:amidase [Halieaceae bacterium]